MFKVFKFGPYGGNDQKPLIALGTRSADMEAEYAVETILDQTQLDKNGFSGLNLDRMRLTIANLRVSLSRTMETRSLSAMDTATQGSSSTR